MHSFGAILKNLRTSRKLSIDQLAKQINEKYQTKISKSMISRYENNLSEPKMDIVRVFADFFDASPEYIMGINQADTEPKEKTSKAIETIAAHLEGKDITDEKMKDVLKYIDFIFQDED
ncbi:helix-turn-helix domain-containing protein [Bacillus massiliigorillae]|uniref:helix-turn-helix domain-containing protein n=1 Tax=Bacillus massiliigorillae TaxID=1243664 RepID=UPI0003A4CCAF